MKKTVHVKWSLMLLAMFIVSVAQAQRVLTPNAAAGQRMERFKPNVTSLVIKANPATLAFGYLDAGVEVRNQKTGWTLMNHSKFTSVANFGEYYSPDVPQWEANVAYVRFAADHRWYYKTSPFVEKYAALYANAGMSWFSYTTDVVPGDFGQGFYLPANNATFDTQARIDFIVGGELGRTRNWFAMNSPFYGESSWKLGYNLGRRSPQLLWTFRVNYIAN